MILKIFVSILKSKMNLIDSLIQKKVLKTKRIIKAFRKIKRKDFLPQDLKSSANLNKPLPIGEGQTISQPLVVAFMLELLKPEKGDKVLDVGSGSGYTSALLSQLVGSEGKVIAIEIKPNLKEFGEKNNSKYGFVREGRVKFICGDGSKGCKKEASFDRILCSAAVQNKIPKAWKKQLKIKGRIVTSIKSSIHLLVKESKDDFEVEKYPGFAFVPLKEK